MGVIFLAVIVLSMLGPVLLASMIADLTRTQVIILLAVGGLIGGYFALRDSDLYQSYYWAWTVPAAPPDEAAFIAAAEKLHAMRLDYAAGTATAAALHQSEAAICALPSQMSNWVGRVAQKYLADSNRGESLSVELRPHVIVRTSLFPDDTRTLIPLASPAFAVVQALPNDAVVRFDGRIVGRAGACPGDPPIDRNEKLRDPEFLFSFADVRQAQGR